MQDTYNIIHYHCIFIDENLRFLLYTFLSDMRRQIWVMLNLPHRIFDRDVCILMQLTS